LEEEYKYLPYASSANNGEFKTDPFGDQAGFYGSTYISEQPALRGSNTFMAAPYLKHHRSSRPLKTFASGNNWVGSEGASAEEHAMQVQYTANTASDQVRLWTIGYSTDITGNVPASTSFFDAGATV
jgi:hypothetical protein